MLVVKFVNINISLIRQADVIIALIIAHFVTILKVALLVLTTLIYILMP